LTEVLSYTKKAVDTPCLCIHAEKWRSSSQKAWPIPQQCTGAPARRSGAFSRSITALSLVPLAVFQLFCTSLQFLTVILVYRLCSYITEIKLAFPPSPLVSPPQRAQCSFSLALLPVSHVPAALVVPDSCSVVQCDHCCELSKSAQACATRSDSDPSDPSAPFPTPSHASAALSARGRRTSDLVGHPYEVPYSAEACATTRDASHPLELAANPERHLGLVSLIVDLPAHHRDGRRKEERDKSQGGSL
jgi:hypothetical protein